MPQKYSIEDEYILGLSRRKSAMIELNVTPVTTYYIIYLKVIDYIAGARRRASTAQPLNTRWMMKGSFHG